MIGKEVIQVDERDARSVFEEKLCTLSGEHVGFSTNHDVGLFEVCAQRCGCMVGDDVDIEEFVYRGLVITSHATKIEHVGMWMMRRECIEFVQCSWERGDDMILKDDIIF